MVARPPLPFRYLNPKIKEHLNGPTLPAVKYQILNCQGKDILVGRLKIETPTDTGHAFILRRFDTGAISLTTMFRAAFPAATDNEERAEIQWVRDTYDLTGNNGSSKDAHITRLAGTWVSPDVAIELGKAYHLSEIIDIVVQATPDPTGNYRRSGKTAAASVPAPVAAVPQSAPSGASTHTPVVAPPTPAASVVSVKPPSAVRSLPTPSPTSQIPPSKRRRESSPVQSSKAPSSRASPAPSQIPTPRRSGRTKSPAPRSPAATTVLRTPRVTRVVKKETVSVTMSTPGGSELSAVEEESQFVEEGVAGAELHAEDVREQQKLIADLKAKRAADQLAAEQVKMEETEGVVEEVQAPVASSSSNKKREREDEEPKLQFEFKEPENMERAMVTNRRAARMQLEPKTKSFAWGLAAFAVGLGAVYLPNFF